MSSREVETAARRLESARSNVHSARDEVEAWSAQCAGLKRSIDELQRTLASAEGCGEAARRRLQKCEDEADEAERALVEAEGRRQRNGGTLNSPNDDDMRRWSEAAGLGGGPCETSSPHTQRSPSYPQHQHGRHSPQTQAAGGGSPGSAHERIYRAEAARRGAPRSPGTALARAGSPHTPPPPQDHHGGYGTPPRTPGGGRVTRVGRLNLVEDDPGDGGGGGGRPMTVGEFLGRDSGTGGDGQAAPPASPGGTGTRCYSPSSRHSGGGGRSPSPWRASDGGEAAGADDNVADGPAVVVEGAGFGAANGTYRRSAAHPSPTYSMPGSWLWRSGRYVLHRETNSSWRLGFWPEAHMATFPGSVSGHYTLYRGTAAGGGCRWEVVPSGGGSTPELRTSARVPAPRVSLRGGGEVPRPENPSTSIEAAAVAVGGARRASSAPRPPAPSTPGRTPPPPSDGTAKRTRVQSLSPGRSSPGWTSSTPGGTAGRTKVPSSPERTAAVVAPPPSSRRSGRGRLIDTVTVVGAGTPEVNGVYTRHPDHLLDGCQAFGKTSYHRTSNNGPGGPTRSKRTMAICRVTANNGRFWFIKEKGSGYFYCARERRPDEPPRDGWRVSSYSSGAGPAPRLEW